MKRESSKLFRLDLAIREAGIVGRGMRVGRIERGGGRQRKEDRA